MPKTKKFDKTEVLSAAATLFQQKGYNGTSMEEVLKATGLSRSSLYDTFGDKHNLYIESLEFYQKNSLSHSEKIEEKPINGLQKIDYLFKNVVNHLIAYPNDNGCLLVNAAAEMSKQCFKTQQVICNNKDEVQDLLTNWLNDAQDSKVLKLTKPTKNYSQFLYNTLLGLRVMSQSGASKQELNNIIKVTIDSLN